MVAYQIYSCKGQGYIQLVNGAEPITVDSTGQLLEENALYNIEFDTNGVTSSDMITKIKDVGGSAVMYVRFQVPANTIYTLDDAEYNKYGVYDERNNNTEYRASYCDNFLLVTFPDFSQSVNGPIYEIYSCNGNGYIVENGGKTLTTDNQGQALEEHKLYNLRFDEYGFLSTSSITKVRDVVGAPNLMYVRFEVPNQVIYSVDIVNNVQTTFITLGNNKNNLDEYAAEYCSGADNNNKFLKVSFIRALEPEPIPEPDPTCPENQYRLSDGNCHPCTQDYFYSIGQEKITCHPCKQNYYIGLDGTSCEPDCPINSSVQLIDGNYHCSCNDGYYYADTNVCLAKEIPFYQKTWFIVTMVIIALIIIAIIIGVSVSAAKKKKNPDSSNDEE